MAGLPTRDTVEFVLSGAPARDRAAEVERLLEACGRRFSLETADALADALEATGEHAPADGSPMRSYVRARLLAGQGRREEALAALTAALRALPGPDPWLLGLRARWLAVQRRYEEAELDLRRALHAFPPYPFYVRTERLVDQLSAPGVLKPRRSCRVAILASSTTALLAPVLRAALFRDGIHARTYEGPFGTLRQEILDQASGLYAFAPEVVILLVNHRDLALPPAGGRDEASRFCRELRELWRVLHDRRPCHIVQVGLDVPCQGAWGGLEDTLPDGRRRVLMAANAELGDRLTDGVSFLSVDGLVGASGGMFASDQAWHDTKQYPHPAALPLFADAVAAQCRAVLGLSSRVLVVDLDNTLWGGVVGEDGMGGIRIGPPSGEGEGYLALQEYIRELKQRGVILAVCSKNDLAEAQAVFRSRDGMCLKLEDFAAFTANWQDKVSNLQALASDLSLGLDSFVFLDDSPFERSAVREGLPQIVVPEVAPEPWSMIAALRRGMYFEANVLTGEDLARNASYQVAAAMRTAQQSPVSLEDFLAGLGMVCEHGPVGEPVLARVAQLVGKTNQFNLTTRRYTVEEIRRLSVSPEWWCHWFKLSDRFGDHGLVGAMFARIERSRWEVDTWVLSCRVLGRQLEKLMCGCLVDAAAERGASEILGEYIPTTKNEVVRGLYAGLGFERADEGRYSLALGRGQRPRSSLILGRAVRLEEGKSSSEAA